MSSTMVWYQQIWLSFCFVAMETPQEVCAKGWLNEMLGLIDWLTKLSWTLVHLIYNTTQSQLLKGLWQVAANYHSCLVWWWRKESSLHHVSCYPKYLPAYIYIAYTHTQTVFNYLIWFPSELSIFSHSREGLSVWQIKSLFGCLDIWTTYGDCLTCCVSGLCSHTVELNTLRDIVSNMF